MTKLERTTVHERAALAADIDLRTAAVHADLDRMLTVDVPPADRLVLLDDIGERINHLTRDIEYLERTTKESRSWG